jgi:hypothetical protein
MTGYEEQAAGERPGLLYYDCWDILRSETTGWEQAPNQRLNPSIPARLFIHGFVLFDRLKQHGQMHTEKAQCSQGLEG